MATTKTYIDTQEYTRAHGAEPSKNQYGCWLFRSADGGITETPYMTYRQATKHLATGENGSEWTLLP